MSYIATDLMDIRNCIRLKENTIELSLAISRSVCLSVSRPCVGRLAPFAGVGSSATWGPNGKGCGGSRDAAGVVQARSPHYAACVLRLSWQTNSIFQL